MNHVEYCRMFILTNQWRDYATRLYLAEQWLGETFISTYRDRKYTNEGTRR